MTRGDEAVPNDTKGFFRFNSGKQKKTFPDYNPYTIRRCNDCDIAKGKLSLAFTPENDLCQACKLVRQCRDQQRTTQFRNYVKEKKGKAKNFRKDAKSLNTGSLYQSKKSFKRAVQHARNIEEVEMYADISRYINIFSFVRESPLGEGENLKDPKDAANVAKKRKRGVTKYNVYKLVLGNDIWEVKTEVYKNQSETIYFLRKEK